MQYSKMNREELEDLKSELKKQYDDVKSQNLKLNMARGKPSPEQLGLSMDMLNSSLSASDWISEDGTDVRNYGGLDGIPECKKLFADELGVAPENIIVGGASSLNLMYDYISQCYTHGAGAEPWCRQGDVKFICNVPGYDRHFGICEHFGIKMINVRMTETGPDVAKIAELVKDPSVKGMFCVPKYSNPDGITYSDETVRALAALKPSAPDFRVIWDNAYIVHDLCEDADTLLNIFDACKEFGTEDNFIEFTSTSKITFPGAGISAIAASPKNIAMIKDRLKSQTISYDKMNQLRHVKYFKNADGIKAHMKKHAKLLAPKFNIVLETLEKELKDNDLASWSSPKGGYFISLDVNHCSAKRVGEICKELGVVLTTVGATFPYGIDPDDRNIRIAPSYPSTDELQKAADILCLAVKLATIEALV